MVRLLGRASSLNVQKVRWIAAEIGLDLDHIEVGGPFGGNDTDDYRKLNPTGLVPTIVDGAFTLWESNAIVGYLAEAYGSAPWQPARIEDRARAHQWMDYMATSVAGPLGTVYVSLIRTKPEDRDVAAFDKALTAVTKAMRLIDSHLAENPFLTGTAPSMGDVPLGCAAYRWHNLPIVRPELPHLKRWYDSLASRLAYRENVMLPMV